MDRGLNYNGAEILIENNLIWVWRGAGFYVPECSVNEKYITMHFIGDAYIAGRSAVYKSIRPGNTGMLLKTDWHPTVYEMVERYGRQLLGNLRWFMHFHREER